jgi:2-polyprenyl-3-methyl-5-hydroxy-6-metoxy-1,4-benzoquinol methylase
MEPSNLPLKGNRLHGGIEQVTRCLVCDCQDQKPLFQGRDDRYGYPGAFTVVACPNCGLAYLSTRPQAAQVADLYQKYYPEVNYEVNTTEPVPAWKALLKNSPLMAAYLWIKITRENLYANLPLRPGQRILDVGSGAVDLKDVRQIIRHGSEWLAVEVDEKKCRALATAGLQTFLGTIEAFQATGPAPFDYIVLSQVLEHVYQPRQFLDSCRSLLKPGGRIILSCPNYDSFLRKKSGDRWLHWHIPYHVAHYSHGNVRLLANAVGLHVAGFYTYTPVTWFFAQQQIARGRAYNDSFLGRHGLRWGQRLLDYYLAPYHRQHQGDALFAELELA